MWPAVVKPPDFESESQMELELSIRDKNDPEVSIPAKGWQLSFEYCLSEIGLKLPKIFRAPRCLVEANLNYLKRVLTS